MSRSSRRVAGGLFAAVLMSAGGGRLAIAAPPVSPATPAAGQTPSEDDLPAIRLSGAGVELMKLGIPRAEGDAESARVASETLSRDMDITGLFQVLDPASFPPQLQTEGLSFSSALWSQVGAQAVVKLKVSGAAGQLEGRVYALARGDTAMLSRTYGFSGGDVRGAVHDLANDIVSAFTGQRGIFGSRIAYAQTGRAGREIGVVDADGGRLSTVTHMESDCLLPAFSPSGTEIAFSSYLRNNPDLWIVAANGGRARRVSQHPGMNTGAVWGRDGSIVLTLSFPGNAELYRIGAADGAIRGRLTNNPAIDSSPSLSPEGASGGSQIAFVSNRQGSPQIFVMPAAGGTARRLTFQGKYNQTPRFNPDPKRPLIAFTGRDERGVFDVFFIDLRNQQVTRVTQSRGSNMDPDWSPDGRLLVYASSRGGLFVANPETRHEVQISHGGAASPSWGPVPGH
jgi:TolB protein